MCLKSKNFLSYGIWLFLTVFTLNSNAQIETYPWPVASELVSDSKYEVRVRTFDPGSNTFGDWVDMVEFLSLPRNYPDHWKVKDDAVLGSLKDRTMTFVKFAFNGHIEVEVTHNLSAANAHRVEIAPKAFGFVPHYFDGKTVRFRMDKPQYISVNFDFGPTDLIINGDDDGHGGKNIKNGMVLLTDYPEIQSGYTIPVPSDPGVVVWSNDTPLSEIRNADIIYFPAGETNMKEHPDRWEKDGKTDFASREGNWVTTKAEYDNAPLYRGRLFLGKDGQKVYLSPGAVVHGGFFSNGHSNNWLYGRGIVSGRKHLMHEIIMPQASDPIAIDQQYNKITQTKESFCHYGNGAQFHGVLFLEPWHHTCPSGQNSVIQDIKIIGWCFNNDGIRPSTGSVIDRLFIKTNDDYDYARDPHTVSNAVFWPGNNCGLGMLGWGNLGTGYAEYDNCHVINAEWNRQTVAQKGNVGFISGGKADEGIQLQNNKFHDIHIENPTNFFSAVLIEQAGSAPEGFLRNFSIKNVTTEFPFQTPNGSPVKQEMTGRNNTWVEGWTYTNFIVNGVLVTWDNYKDYFDLDLTGTNGSNVDDAKRCRNVTFNSEGDLHSITYTTEGNGALRPQGKENVIQAIGGSSPMLSLTPSPGNRIKSITVDGTLVYEYGSTTLNKRLQNIVFDDISSNHTVNVVFEAGTDLFDLPVVETTELCDDEEPPTAPGQPTLIEQGLASLEIEWTASTDNVEVLGYEVYVDGQLKMVTSGNSAIIKGLRCDTSYELTVRAFDCINNSELSAPVSYSTLECQIVEGYSGVSYFEAPFVIPSEENLWLRYFDKGEMGVVFNDADMGNATDYDPTQRDDEWASSPHVELSGGNIFKVSNGEWWRYTVEVAEDGLYTTWLNYGGGTANVLSRSLQLTIYSHSFDQLYSSTVVFDFGGDTPISPKAFDEVELVAGTYIFELKSNYTGARPNLDFFSFSKRDIPSSIDIVNGETDLVKVFPNPFGDQLVIAYSQMPESIKLYSIQGLPVHAVVTMGSQEAVVNTSNLPKGVYVVDINGITKKVVKR